MRKDYSIYRLTFFEGLLSLLISLGITGVVAYLFYRSVVAFIVFPIILKLVNKIMTENCRKKCSDKLLKEFLDATRVVSTSLEAGLSMENSWLEAAKEVKMLHGEESDMYKELELMNQALNLSQPVELVIWDFAKRSGIEDIISFAETLLFAKRCGGDFIKIIARTTDHIRQKQETEEEIKVMIAGRKSEQMVMNVIPLFILAYLGAGSGDYMDSLYHNTAGVAFMSLCLLLYLFAVYISTKLMDIKV